MMLENFQNELKKTNRVLVVSICIQKKVYNNETPYMTLIDEIKRIQKEYLRTNDLVFFNIGCDDPFILLKCDAQRLIKDPYMVLNNFNHSVKVLMRKSQTFQKMLGFNDIKFSKETDQITKE